MQDELPTHQQWADTWRNFGDRMAAEGDQVTAEHSYYLATQNQRAADDETSA